MSDVKLYNPDGLKQSFASFFQCRWPFDDISNDSMTVPVPRLAGAP